MFREKVKESSMKDLIQEAIKDLEIAEQNERNADPEYIEVAIEATNIARQHLNNLIKRIRLHSA